MVSEKSQDTENLRFEEALSRLEAILESMETGEVPLDDLVSKYEEGSLLLKTCHARLQEAELKIETLQGKKDLKESMPLETEDGTTSTQEDA